MPEVLNSCRGMEWFLFYRAWVLSWTRSLALPVLIGACGAIQGIRISGSSSRYSAGVVLTQIPLSIHSHLEI
jgi:hypothetical protein